MHPYSYQMYVARDYFVLEYWIHNK